MQVRTSCVAARSRWLVLRSSACAGSLCQMTCSQRPACGQRRGPGSAFLQGWRVDQLMLHLLQQQPARRVLVACHQPRCQIVVTRQNRLRLACM